MKTSYIRYNQVGYLISDQKIAIIGSQKDLEGKQFYLVKASNPNKVVYTGTIMASRGSKNTPFEYNLACDFSNFKTPGHYRLRINVPSVTLSGPFAIGVSNMYRDVLKLVMEFFRSQKCGDTNPILHKVCHLNDRKAAIDASGGWHDAGDYLKFMITATFTTVELLTAADYARTYHFENAMADVSPKDGIPDIIAEARVGLEWILNMTSDYKNGNYYYQVGSAEAHNYWRMPAKDTFEGGDGHRKVYKGWGGNLLGKSAAALAIAYRIFQKYDKKFAAKCLKRAKALFKPRDKYEYAQPANPANFYNETTWQDDMVLGAIELYISTKEMVYLKYVKANLKKIKGDGLSWGHTNYLVYAACYKAGVDTTYCKNQMTAILEKKEQKVASDVYRLSSRYTWGTTALLTADAQKAIMYYYLTSNPAFLNIATNERDYLLGRNNWGVSFIVGVGTNSPQHIQSQINSLCCLQRGAVVGGPAKKSSWRKVFPNLNVSNGRFSKFQSNVVYHDNVKDYYTNEAALDYTAPSVFIFLYNIDMNKKHGKNIRGK